MNIDYLECLSTVLAFLFGAMVVCLDCRLTMATRVLRIPSNFWTDWGVISLSVACGVMAAVACGVVIAYPDGAMSKVVSFSAPDPLRGICVGTSVLIMLRSKLFNIQDSPIGGEYLYREGSEAAIRSVHVAWTTERTDFIRTNLDEALKDSNFEANLASFVGQVLSVASQALSTRVC